jgi:DNA invertase Pin-like site-specific DNA recombinase
VVPAGARLTLPGVAELEAGMIAARTKAALQAVKARGKKLGGYRGNQLTDAACAAGCKAVQERADARAADLAPNVRDAQQAGARSLRAIAAVLNARGIPTPRGRGTWQAGTVSQLLARLPARDAEAPP